MVNKNKQKINICSQNKKETFFGKYFLFFRENN